jgi:hypothetical protein
LLAVIITNILIHTAYVGASLKRTPTFSSTRYASTTHNLQIGFGFIAMQQRKMENLKEIITLLKTKTTVS